MVTYPILVLWFFAPSLYLLSTRVCAQTLFISCNSPHNSVHQLGTVPTTNLVPTILQGLHPKLSLWQTNPPHQNVHQYETQIASVMHLNTIVITEELDTNCSLEFSPKSMSNRFWYQQSWRWRWWRDSQTVFKVSSDTNCHNPLGDPPEILSLVLSSRRVALQQFSLGNLETPRILHLDYTYSRRAYPSFVLGYRWVIHWFYVTHLYT